MTVQEMGESYQKECAAPVTEYTAESYWEQRYRRTQNWLDKFQGAAAELEVRNLQLRNDLDKCQQFNAALLEGMRGIRASFDAVEYFVASLEGDEAIVQIQ